MASAPSGMAASMAPGRRQSTGTGTSSRTLNFYQDESESDHDSQAMRDFKQMFPTMDEEIIEAVLRANNGEVDATIDQLLTMSIDLDEPTEPPPPLPEKKKDVDLPPSYEQAMRASLIKQPETLHISDSDSSSDDDLLTVLNNEKDQIDGELILRAPSPPTTQAPPIPTVSPPSRTDLLSSDIGSFDQTVRAECSPPVPKRPDTVKLDSVKLDSTVKQDVPPDVIPRRSSGPELPPKRYKNRRPYRRWNPPLLGTLPDDFLRLDTSGSKSRWGTDSLDAAKRSVSERLSPLGASKQRSTSPGHSVSLSTSPKARSPKQTFRSMSLTSGDSILDKPKIQPRKSLMEATQTELSGDIIKRRMAENAIRRSSLPVNTDPSIAQELEDERLALMLQNEMFLNELQRDEDFMKTLERDRLNAVAFEPAGPGRLSDDDEAEHEGYGEDNTITGDLVAHRPMGSMENADRNAEFRRQLAQMGQSSKGKFMAVARRFFRVRRKSPRHVLTKDSTAPSTMNLLDDFEDEGLDEPSKEDLPFFEPLPDAEDMTSYRLKVHGGNHKHKQNSRESEA